MSFDPLSLPNNNNNPTQVTQPNPTMDLNNPTNSLKRVSSPQFQYKYSKNKHLSQQIHKKKKNRNKQYHKKKKPTKPKTKFKTHQNKPNQRQPNKKQSKQKKSKLKKSQSLLLTPINQTNRNEFEINSTYIKRHNEMNHKHKKIQVLPNNNTAHYYFETTSISNKNLHNFNYNIHRPVHQCEFHKQPHKPTPKLPNAPTATTTRNTCNDNKILWISSPAILKCSPSPMMLPNISQSPLLLPTNKGEVLMGFELTNDGNDSIKPQKSGQRSVLSDYKYEGIKNYNNIESIKYNLNNCLNTLKGINNYKQTYKANEIDVNMLNQMELIINQLKAKIINGNDDEEKYENENENMNEFENKNILSTDNYNSATDSSFLRSHVLDDRTDSTSEHENEDEDEYNDNGSNQSLIGGVMFMEKATPNELDEEEVVYYD